MLHLQSLGAAEADKFAPAPAVRHNSLKGCAVSTRIPPLGDVTDSFVDAVRSYVAHRREGRLEDASSSVPEAGLKFFGHVRRLHYVVSGKINELFTATVAPAPNGLIDYQLTRRLPAKPQK